MKQKNKKNKKKLSKLLKIQERPSMAFREMSIGQASELANHYYDKANAVAVDFIVSQLLADDPDNLDYYCLLLNAWVKALDIEQGDKVAAIIVQQFPSNSKALREVAAYHRFKLDQPLAYTLIKQGLSTCPGDIALSRDLADLYIALGDNAKAASVCGNMLTRDPGNGAAYWVLIRALAGDLPEQECALLIQAIKKQPRDKMDRAFQLFTQAWVNRKKLPELYSDNLIAANDWVRAMRPFDFNHYTTFSNNNYEYVRWHVESGMPSTVTAQWSPIFIAAMPRSGSTLLEQMLGSHKGCFAVGESNAFQSSIGNVSAEYGLNQCVYRWKQGKTYLDKLPLFGSIFECHPAIAKAKADGLRAIDKSIETSQLLGHMLLTYPNAKVIYLRRHPLDVILSCYHQFFTHGHAYSFDLSDLARVYIQTQLDNKRWAELFPGRIVQVSYEKLVNDSETVMRDVMGFCGLEWDDSCLKHDRHISSINTSSDIQVRRPVYTDAVSKWKAYESMLSPAIEVLKASGVEL